MSAETCGDVPVVSGAIAVTSWDVTRRRSNAMDTVRYECDEDKQHYGSAIVVCQQNGQWTSPLPLCLSKFKVEKFANRPENLSQGKQNA